MTTEERIAIIQNKAKKDYERKNAKKTAEENLRQNMADEIRKLADRIEAIITLANTCVANGVEIPEDRGVGRDYNSGEKYGYPHEFIAEGIYHHTGLLRTWGCYTKGTYEYLGINNGGACGVWDFWTDGHDVWAVHERDSNNITVPRIEDMEQFLKEFPVFEAAFLKWIDSLE